VATKKVEKFDRIYGKFAAVCVSQYYLIHIHAQYSGNGLFTCNK